MMNSIDLTPLYRSSIGFDSLASMLDRTLTTDPSATTYPPYNIEIKDDNKYGITLAVAGFSDDELDITVEKGVLTIRGKNNKEEARKYLHQGIANRSFEQKFNLAEYVEVTGADLNDGLLTINLVKEVPEAMKPKSITIGKKQEAIEDKTANKKEISREKAA
jgi:molecular chaperone IbpA